MEEEEPSRKRIKPNNPVKIFSFQLTPATLLKQSIASLCDSNFNPNGLGSLKITPETGVEIFVRNPQTQVMGSLNLQVSGLLKFYCKKPICNYMINLNQLSQILFHAADSSTVLVFLVDGSPRISFLFSNVPFREFHVDFWHKIDEIMEFPCCTNCGVTYWETESLRQIIERFEQTGRDQLDSMEIAEEPKKYDDGDELVVEFEVLVTGAQKQHVWIHLQHLQSLKKASFLVPYLRVNFLSKPLNNFLLEFTIGSLGELVFMSNTMKQ